MAVHTVTLANLTLLKPPQRAEDALRELRAALLPLAPILTNLARIAKQNPDVRVKSFEIPNIGKVALKDVEYLVDLLYKLENDERLMSLPTKGFAL